MKNFIREIMLAEVGSVHVGYVQTLICFQYKLIVYSIFLLG